MKKHPLVSSASHNDVLLCITCVYLVSLDYEISLPHIIRHSNEEVAKGGKIQLRT